MHPDLLQVGQGINVVGKIFSTHKYLHLKLFAAGTTRSSEKVGGGKSGRGPHRGDSSKNNLENHPVYQTQVKVKVTHDSFLGVVNYS